MFLEESPRPPKAAQCARRACVVGQSESGLLWILNRSSMFLQADELVRLALANASFW